MKVLMSVSDKTGIVEFAYQLVELGYEIVSTGGTYKTLSENGVAATPIEQLTDFPEMLDGRVKTLHPHVHGGILAKRDNKSHMKTCEEHQISLIDLVVVNLYPFKETVSKPNVTLKEAVENIDIGGPTMIRSAAKNYESVGVVVNPSRYASVIEDMKANKGKLSTYMKQLLVCEAFAHTANYDSVIMNYFERNVHPELKHHDIKFPDLLLPVFHKKSELRYGENPHQVAALYQLDGRKGLMNARQLHGKELSYNNYIDLDAAWHISQSYDLPGVAIIKHTNPCGAAVGEDISEAYDKALASDPVSAFGSIIGMNRLVDLEVAEKLNELFVEAVIAPGFDDAAFSLLSKKKSIRLMTFKPEDYLQSDMVFRHVSGGLLVQSQDDVVTTAKQFKVVTKTKPSKSLENDLVFAMNTVKFVKSNAILVAANGTTIGVGAGQMSRVEAVEIALKKAGKKAKGAVLASDAFFPFKDNVELAAKAGIAAIVQPGGSVRDAESIAACDEAGIAMVFTGVRHFRH